MPIDRGELRQRGGDDRRPVHRYAVGSDGNWTASTCTGLYIETNYYFAVAATDAGGNRGALIATPMSASCGCMSNCCAARFNVTQIPSSSGTNEQFGRNVSGEGDLNGDGFSDILVGTSAAGRAYLFFGNGSFSATAPSVTFTGSAANFGLGVAQIGDIDNDGLPDLAIADPLTTLRVFIYKGRAIWPMMLTDADADYVITTDASYAASGFGLSLAGIGDFTGDGVNDLAIGARGFAGGVGRVVIVPGR